MKKLIFWIGFAILLISSILLLNNVSAKEHLQERLDQGDTTYLEVSDVSWVAQATRPGIDGATKFFLTNLSLKGYREAVGGLMYINITVANNTGAPNVPYTTIANATFDYSTITNAAGGEWFNISFDMVEMNSSTNYSIVLYTDLGTGDSFRWRFNVTTDSYPFTNAHYSTDGGGSWLVTTGAAQGGLFQMWGVDFLVDLDTPADNFESSSNNITFNASILASGLDITNATIYVHNATALFNITTQELSGEENVSEFNITNLIAGEYNWNVLACAENVTDVICEFNENNRSFIVGIFNTTMMSQNSTAETEYSYFNLTFNVLSGTPTVKFWFNNTPFSSTVTELANNYWRASYNFDMFTSNGTFDTLWEIILPTVRKNSSTVQHTIDLLNISICDASNTVPFLNFTYTNETVSLEDVTASVPYSTWNYYVGTGSLYKTQTFAAAAESPSHAFCGTPADKTINMDLTWDYTNANSQQRRYQPGIQSLNNGTSNITLYLLPTSEGIYVTFQVINAAEQPISGATVALSRSGFDGNVTITETGDSGTAAIFLDPDATYTLYVFATGYNPFTATQQFPTSEFTVNLGQASEEFTDLMRGITFQTRPGIGFLTNDTTYNFNFTIASTYWNLDEYGFRIVNETGDLLGSASDTAATGGTTGVNVNVEKNRLVFMEYYWVINGSYVNGTTLWGIEIPSEGSIKSFFQRLSAYIDDGVFGLDSFGLSVILFLIIFLTVGLLSFKFGLNSPEAIAIIAFFIIVLFDVGFGIVPDPFPNALPHFISFISFMVLIALWLGRLSR